MDSGEFVPPSLGDVHVSLKGRASLKKLATMDEEEFYVDRADAPMGNRNTSNFALMLKRNRHKDKFRMTAPSVNSPPMMAAIAQKATLIEKPKKKDEFIITISKKKAPDARIETLTVRDPNSDGSPVINIGHNQVEEIGRIDGSVPEFVHMS